MSKYKREKQRDRGKVERRKVFDKVYTVRPRRSNLRPWLKSPQDYDFFQLLVEDFQSLRDLLP